MDAIFIYKTIEKIDPRFYLNEFIQQAKKKYCSFHPNLFFFIYIKKLKE